MVNVQTARIDWRRSYYAEADNSDALRKECEALRRALSFYADPTRYHGPNQPQDGHDEWSERVGLRAYRLDVTRDQGAIARAAVGAA